MNDVEKLIAIMDGGVDSPALAYGLSALIFAHDDECPKLADVTAVCNCDPDIYDGLTNQKIEAARPAPAGSEECFHCSGDGRELDGTECRTCYGMRQIPAPAGSNEADDASL